MKSILLIVFLCVGGVAMAQSASNPTGQWDQGQKLGDPSPTPCYGPAGSC